MQSVIQRAMAWTVFSSALIGGLGGLGGCSINPATGARSFTMMSWDEERKIGAEAGPAFTEQFGGAVPDSEASAYMSEIGNKLLAGIEEGVPELEWEFTLLDSDVLNAFALPGGKVFFSRGLAKELKSEAEMAGVIGHEIGHVTARHGNQRMSKQLGFNILMGIGAVVVGTADADSDVRKYGQYAVPALAIGGNVVLLSYGRNEELEADKLGMRYMSRAGYDPVGQRRVMETLGRLSGGGAPIEWLSTHPASETRIYKINQMLGDQYLYTQNNPEFVIDAASYSRRMLARLEQLGPAKHSGKAPEETAGVEGLGASVAWCAHCQEEALAMAMAE